MNRLIALAALIFVPFVAYSYPSDDLLIPLQLPSADTLRHKASVSRNELLQDIAILEEAFRNGYGGWAVFSRQLEQEIFPALRSLNKEKYSTQEFCDHVGKALDVIADYHISALYYKAPNPCQKTGLRKGQVGSNIKPRDEIPWGYFEKEIRGKKVPVIAITHLPNPYFAGWAGFINKIHEIHSTAPALVIDIRGNGGGSDSMPTRMAKILYGMANQADFPYPPSQVVRRQSPEALALFVNNYGFRILISRLNGSEPSEDITKTYDEWKARYDMAVNGELDSEEIIRNPDIPVDLEKVFKGPIRLLVDGECGSSCESTVDSFELHPNAKTVGENTAGFVHFGNLGRLWLRNSNLLIDIPTQRFTIDDGRFVEKVGYVPKIPVAAGINAMDIALEDIARTLEW